MYVSQPFHVLKFLFDDDDDLTQLRPKLLTDDTVSVSLEDSDTRVGAQVSRAAARPH